MIEGIEITDTNGGEDSNGEAFGLSGNLIYVALGGLVGSILLFLVLNMGMSKSVLVSLIFSVPLTGGVLAYILLLKQGKPQGYDRDYLENLLFGSSWTLNVFNQPETLKLDDTE